MRRSLFSCFPRCPFSGVTDRFDVARFSPSVSLTLDGSSSEGAKKDAVLSAEIGYKAAFYWYSETDRKSNKPSLEAEGVKTQVLTEGEKEQKLNWCWISAASSFCGCLPAFLVKGRRASEYIYAWPFFLQERQGSFCFMASWASLRLFFMIRSFERWIKNGWVFF